MPSFCPVSTIDITTANYMALYTQPQGVPSAVPPLTVFKTITTGTTTSITIDNTVLNPFVTSFLNYASAPSTITPAADMNVAESFATKSKTLRDSMQAEFCWYYNRYIWALDKLLTETAQPGGVTVPNLRVNVGELNKKLNGILLVMKASVNSRMNTLNGYYTTDINSQNQALDNARNKLAQHSAILQNNDLKSDVQAAMVDYSIEKNSSSRNLLAVYGFMNIVAVGLLFYLYTNTKE